MKSRSLKSVDDLRNYALRCLERLESRDMEIEEAGVAGKLCEAVMTTVKYEIDYCRLLKKEPCIPFLGDVSKNKPLLLETTKLLESKK